MAPYAGMLRKAIHSFKYSKNTLLAVPLGHLLSLHGDSIMDGKQYDAIIPVPLHPIRLRQRGFNQSLMLANRVGKSWGVNVKTNFLERLKWTTPQTMLSQNERKKNVKGVFSCKNRESHVNNILLIDDVYTSGSTVNECSRILKKNGAIQVDVLTLARTQGRQV